MKTVIWESKDESVYEQLLSKKVPLYLFRHLSFAQVKARNSSDDLYLMRELAISYSARMGWQQADCDDISQSVLIEFRKRHSFNGTISGFCWRNVRDFGSALRIDLKRRHAISLSGSQSIDVADFGMDRIREAQENLEWFRITTTSRDFAIIRDHFFFGYTQVETAIRVGVSRRTVIRVISSAKRAYFAEFGVNWDC